MAEEIADPVAGYALTPPEGWEAAHREGRVVAAPPDGTGLLMAIPHAATALDEVTPLFEGGWSEQGLDLRPAGPVESGESRASVPLAGTADGQEVRGMLTVLLGPYAGGVLLIGAAPVDGPDPREVVEAVASTVRFSEPDVEGFLRTWDQRLRGSKLSYYSQYDSSGGGIQERHELVLRPDGRFEQEGEFVASFGEAGGVVERVAPSEGEWRIEVVAGQAILRLSGDETTGDHVLAEGEDGLLLNGRRYFVSAP